MVQVCPYSNQQTRQNKDMNGNVSSAQFSMNKEGAMAISDKFDGPSSIKTPTSNGEMAPNTSIGIAKPGTF